MNDKPKELKLRTKAFALDVIRMYSKLPKNDTVAQVLGKQVLRSGTSVATVLIGKLEIIIFEEAVHEDDEFAHTGSHGDERFFSGGA